MMDDGGRVYISQGERPMVLSAKSSANGDTCRREKRAGVYRRSPLTSSLNVGFISLLCVGVALPGSMGGIHCRDKAIVLFMNLLKYL